MLEQFNKRQKKEIEKLESQHVQQFRSRSKQLKIDQVCLYCGVTLGSHDQSCTFVTIT